MKNKMKTTAALLCAVMLMGSAGGTIGAFADSGYETVTQQINADPTGKEVEVSGSINLSDIPEGAKVTLKGDTVLHCDTARIIFSLGDKYKYSLTIDGDRLLTCTGSITAEKVTVNAPIETSYICAKKVTVNHNIFASNIKADYITVNKGYVNSGIYGDLTVQGGTVNCTELRGSRLWVSGGTVDIASAPMFKEEKQMSNTGHSESDPKYWKDPEIVKITSPAKLVSPKGFKYNYSYSREYVSGESWYCNDIRVSQLVDNKGKTPKNIHITSEISGTVSIAETNIVPGKKLTLIKTGAIADISDDSLIISWQRSSGSDPADASNTWKTVSTGSDYFAAPDDVGHCLRAVVTMDGAEGKLYTAGKPVSKSKCYIDVERASTSYRDGSLYITNGDITQEYLVLSDNKDISSLTENDWKSAVSPENNGEFKVNCTQDRTNYVYTRVKGSPSMYAGTDVMCTPVYCGNITQLQDMTFIVDPVGGGKLTYDGSYVIGKVNEPIKINVAPLPGDATNFNGVRGDQWLISGYNSYANPDGSFFEDEACTKQVEAATQYKTVYLKITKPANNYTIAAQYTRGYNDMVYRAFNLRVADAEGKLKAESISADRLEIPKGFTTLDGIEPSVYPKGGDITGIIFRCSNAETGAPDVYLKSETGMIMVDAETAKIGTYFYDAYIGEEKLMGGVTVDVIKDTVTIHYNDVDDNELYADVEIPIGANYILPPCIIEPSDGYIFEEWIIDEDHGAASGEEITVYSDTVIRPGWISHTHNIKKCDHIEPTCTSEGQKEHYICVDCGYRFTDSEGKHRASAEEYIIPKLPHNWDSGKITTPAAETTPGVVTFTCLVCGETKEVPYSFGNEDKILLKKGDVNGDGTIDIEDAVMVISHINGQDPLNDDEYSRANVDGNTSVDIEDAVAIIAHVNGNKPIE